jgi:hypothetical protein
MSEANIDQGQLVIKLRNDWHAGPFWVSVGDEVPDEYNADEISEVVSLSDELRAAIAAWDERFQRTYNDEVPQDSGINDPAEEAAFIAEGWALARRLKAEVPATTRVRYVPMDTGIGEEIHTEPRL